MSGYKDKLWKKLTTNLPVQAPRNLSITQIRTIATMIGVSLEEPHTGAQKFFRTVRIIFWVIVFGIILSGVGYEAYQYRADLSSYL